MIKKICFCIAWEKRNKIKTDKNKSENYHSMKPYTIIQKKLNSPLIVFGHAVPVPSFNKIPPKIVLNLI